MFLLLSLLDDTFFIVVQWLNDPMHCLVVAFVSSVFWGRRGSAKSLRFYSYLSENGKWE